MITPTERVGMGFYLTADKTWAHRQFTGEYLEEDFKSHERILTSVAFTSRRHAEKVTLGKIQEALGMRGLIQDRAIEAVLDSVVVAEKIEKIVNKALLKGQVSMKRQAVISSLPQDKP